MNFKLFNGSLSLFFFSPEEDRVQSPSDLNKSAGSRIPVLKKNTPLKPIQDIQDEEEEEEEEEDETDFIMEQVSYCL